MLLDSFLLQNEIKLDNLKFIAYNKSVIVLLLEP